MNGMIAPVPVLWALGGVYLILVAASLLIAGMRLRRPERDVTELVQRVRSWWLMVVVFSAAIVSKTSGGTPNVWYRSAAAAPST